MPRCLVHLKYFEHVEEAEWATEVAAGSGLPVVTSLCIGPDGDMHGVSAAQCAVRLAKAGALISARLAASPCSTQHSPIPS